MILPIRLRYRRVNLRTVLFTLFPILCVFILLTIDHNKHLGTQRDSHEEQCSDDDSLDFIDDLCYKYKAGKVVGPFCGHICDTKNLKYQGCANHRYGKRVFFIRCQNICKKNESVTIVMKSKQLGQTQGLEQLLFPINPGEDETIYLQKVRNITHDLIYKALIDYQATDVGYDADIVSLMLGVNFTEFINQHTFIVNITLKTLDNVYSLVNMHEYTFMKLHADKSLVPMIYGTCGPVYIVENTASIDGMITNTKGIASWGVRVKVALKMIELIKRLDTLFDSPIHMCDLKASNFGLRQRSEVTIIDYDCVMLDIVLKEIFKVQRCESDKDCRLCDCFSNCDINSGYCTGTIYSNNIQRLCQNVFMDFRLDLSSGLLMTPPRAIKSELIDVMTLCAYPEGVFFRKRVRDFTSYQVLERLQLVLRDSLKYV